MKKVQELLNELTSKELDKKGNPKKTLYSRKRIASIFSTALNDPEYIPVINYDPKTGESIYGENYFKDTRTWLKKILVQAGMDSADASIVMDPKFELPSADSIYDLFLAVERDCLKYGSVIKLPYEEDFTPNIYATRVPETTKTGACRNIQTGEVNGKYTTTTKAHYEIKASSKVPSWAKSTVRHDW